MRYKNCLTYALPMIVLTGCLLNLTSCKDDHDDNKESKQDKKAITMEMVAQKDAVECILLNLTSVEPQDSTGIDFENRQFEPTIGKVRDKSQPSERSVLVDDEVEAQLKFHALVSNEDFVQETSDGYAIDLTNLDYRQDGRKQKLGKLTYHRATDGTCMGYAEVNVPCVPGLRRISYVTKEQWGNNGWDEDGHWVSPCLFGEVWYNMSQGLYYVCVVQSTSDTDGWLINVQPGCSNMYSKLADNEENKGAWSPDHPVSKVAIEGFVKLCIDGQYYDIKQAIRKRYPNKVFPPVPVRHGKGEECAWNDYGEQYAIDGDNGFGTSQKGYGHWVEDLGSDNPDDYLKPGSGPEVLIIRKAWFGDYAWSPPRYWRKQEVYCIAPRARYDSNRYWYTKKYVYHFFDDSDYCDWMDKKYPYTANGYSFRANPPAGFGSSPVFDPAEEGF